MTLPSSCCRLCWPSACRWGTSAVPTAKEPESMPMSKSNLKKLKSQRPSRSAAEGQAEVNALQQDILQILKGMGRLPLGGLGNQFGSRFSSLRKEGHIEIRKFRQWLESMPGVSIHGKVVDYSKPSSSRARTETGEGTAAETLPKRDPQWRKLIEQSRKVPRRFWFLGVATWLFLVSTFAGLYWGMYFFFGILLIRYVCFYTLTSVYVHSDMLVDFRLEC